MAWIEVAVVKDSFHDDWENGVARATRVYYAKSDVPVAPDAALSASHDGKTVAAGGESYSAARPLCQVVHREVRRVSPRQFEVTASFSDPTNGTPDLLTQPAIITRRALGAMEEYTMDESSPPKPVRTEAGELFQRGPERPVRALLYTIKKYVTPATANQVWPSLFTTNSAAKVIKGFNHAANTLWLADLQDESVTTGILALTVVAEYRPNGFKNKALHAGYYHIDANGDSVRILDANGEPSTKEWPLNPDGTKKASRDADVDELEFTPFKSSSWAGVPLS